jgi:hypothetical protein
MSNSIIDSIEPPEWTPILPCPFCGHPAEIVKAPDYPHATFCGYMIQCGDEGIEGECHASVSVGPFPTLAEATAAWNHRRGKQ